MLTNLACLVLPLDSQDKQKLLELNDINLNHIDLYRFRSPQEWVAAGFNEFINDSEITIIEWAEKAKGVLCEPDIIIEIL